MVLCIYNTYSSYWLKMLKQYWVKHQEDPSTYLSKNTPVKKYGITLHLCKS
jgi:hypothetical protein